MLSSLTLDDANGNAVILHETTKRSVRSVLGLVGIGALRESRRDRPTAHGGIDETLWESGRLVVIEGAVMSSEGIEDAFAEFRAVTKPMIETLDTGPALLKWTEGEAGNQLQRYVKLAAEVEPVLAEGAAYIEYQAQFFAEDPRSYTQTETTVEGAALSDAPGGLVFPLKFPFTFTSSDGGTAPCSNVGNRPTPPTFRVYGECSNPQIVLVETDERIVLQGEVGADDYLEVNAQTRQVRLNGTTPRNNFVDPSSTDWFELPRGSSTVRLIAETFDSDARVDVIYRSAFA